MKKVMLASLLMVSLAFAPLPTTPKEKTFKFEFSQQQVVDLWNTLNFCQASIQTSQSPAIQVKEYGRLIDSLKASISTQYNIQIADTTHKSK